MDKSQFAFLSEESQATLRLIFNSTVPPQKRAYPLLRKETALNASTPLWFFKG